LLAVLLKLKPEWLSRIELLVDEKVANAALEFVGESTNDEHDEVELLLGLNVAVLDVEDLIEFSGVMLIDENAFTP
jgi:hypothetical protein